MSATLRIGDLVHFKERGASRCTVVRISGTTERIEWRTRRGHRMYDLVTPVEPLWAGEYTEHEITAHTAHMFHRVSDCGNIDRTIHPGAYNAQAVTG